jgi:hypothetical protein
MPLGPKSYGRRSPWVAMIAATSTVDLLGEPHGLKKKYARRFAKVMSPARVARFFQIERKLDAVQNLSIAEQIPLIDPS